MQSIESLERRVAEVMAERGIGEAEARVVVANENGFPTWERLVEWNTPIDPPRPAAMMEAIAAPASNAFGSLGIPPAFMEADQPSGLNASKW